MSSLRAWFQRTACASFRLALDLAPCSPTGLASSFEQYFHSYLPPPPKTSHKDTSGGPPKHPLRLQLEQRLKLLPNAPLHLQLTTKFSSLWQELGHNEPKTWKFKAHRFGEKMMDKIEFEEWSLKTVEKGLVPPGLVGVASKESPEEDKEQRKEKVEEAKTLQKDGVKQDKEFVSRSFQSMVGARTRGGFGPDLQRVVSPLIRRSSSSTRRKQISTLFGPSRPFS